MTDFSIVKHGSVWTIRAESAAAKAFAAANFHVEGWMGVPTLFTTDWRPASAIWLALVEEGFSVEAAQ